MQRQRGAKPAAAVLGLGTLVLEILGTWSQRRPAEIGWFAYAPLQTRTSVSYLDTYSSSGRRLLSVAFPGPVALLLATGLTVGAALTFDRVAVLITLAVGAAAAALAQAPGLTTPVGGVLLRLTVVLLPASLALGVRRCLAGAWPWAKPLKPGDQP